MILLVGNNKDDLLYFETIISNKKQEMILGKYPVTIGTISNQSVILLSEIYTNVLSSMIASYIIEKYYVLFVIKVGKSSTLSKSFKDGDVVISTKVKSIDVDVTDLQGIKLGQIPNFDEVYSTRNEIFNTIINSFVKRTSIVVKDAIVLSSNVHYVDTNQLSNLIYDDMIFDVPLNKAIFDSEAFGIATACALYQIPFVSVNVIVNHIGDDFSIENYVKVLHQYSNVGKAIVSTIGDIGNNEVLRR